jgi:hypothetical protein
VIAHELGHLIDFGSSRPGQISGVSARGIRDELERNYSTLARSGPYRETIKPYIRPEDFGYRPGPPSRRELVAEAIRAYLKDPNYFKTVAPNAAAAIRAAVNSHPQLSKLIQFNSVGGLAATGGAIGTAASIGTAPRDESDL